MHNSILLAVLVGSVLTSAQNSGSLCAVAGLNEFGNPYQNLKGSAFANLQGCGRICTKDPACKSFAYSTKACMLFTISVAQNVYRSPKSKFSFYDVGCITPPVSRSTLHSSSTMRSISSPMSSSRPSSTSSSKPGSTSSFPSSTPSLICNASIIDLDDPDYTFRPLRSPYADTEEGCEEACVLTNCQSLYTQGPSCNLLYKPAGVQHPVFTDLDLFGIPKLSDNGCFKGRIGTPTPPSRRLPSGSAAPLCGTGATNFDINTATGVVQGPAVKGNTTITANICAPLCKGMNCGSLGVDPSQGCVFFNASAADVVTGFDSASTFLIYDRNCSLFGG